MTPTPDLGVDPREALTVEQARAVAADIDDLFGLTEEQRQAAAERDVERAAAAARDTEAVSYPDQPVSVRFVGGPLDGAEGEAPAADTNTGLPERVLLEGHDGWYAPTDGAAVYSWIDLCDHDGIEDGSACPAAVRL